MTEATKHHIKRHKKKYTTGAILALAIAILELLPAIKHAISSGGDTRPLVELGKTKLGELEDAGIID